MGRRQQRRRRAPKRASGLERIVLRELVQASEGAVWAKAKRDLGPMVGPHEDELRAIVGRCLRDLYLRDGLPARIAAAFRRGVVDGAQLGRAVGDELAKLHADHERMAPFWAGLAAELEEAALGWVGEQGAVGE